METSTTTNGSQSCELVLSLRTCSTRHRQYSNEEWEAVKPKIETLWMTKNLPLNQVMLLMDTMHGFRASLKQYKDRFRRWGWAKYQKKSTATDQRKVRTPIQGKSCQRPSFNKNKRRDGSKSSSSPEASDSSNEPLIKIERRDSLESRKPKHDPLLHANNTSRYLFNVIHNTFIYMTGSFDREGQWKQANQRLLVGGYEYPFSQVIFTKALISHRENAQSLGPFGRMIRQGFLEVERMVKREHPVLASKCLFEIPFLLVVFGHLSICSIYLRHLIGLYRQRNCNYPLVYIAEAIQKLFEASKDDPAMLREFMTTLANASQAWADRFGSLESRADFPERPGRTYFWLEYVARFLEGWTPDDLINHYFRTDRMLHLVETQTETGGKLSMHPEADLILVQSLLGTFTPEFEQHALNLLERANDDESFASVRLVCYRALAEYYNMKGDWKEVMRYRKLCCVASKDKRDVCLMFELESTLERVGWADEAIETAKARKEFESQLGIKDEDWGNSTWIPAC